MIILHIFLLLSFILLYDQVENTVDPVGSLIEIYKQTDNIILSRLVVIQVIGDNKNNDGYMYDDEEFDE